MTCWASLFKGTRRGMCDYSPATPFYTLEKNGFRPFYWKVRVDYLVWSIEYGASTPSCGDHIENCKREEAIAEVWQFLCDFWLILLLFLEGRAPAHLY